MGWCGGEKGSRLKERLCSGEAEESWRRRQREIGLGKSSESRGEGRRPQMKE